MGGMLGACCAAATLHAAASFDLNDRNFWKADGKGFAKKTATALADSSDSLAGKGAKGILRSDTFPIKADYLNFEIAGGDLALRTSLNLWVGGQVV